MNKRKWLLVAVFVLSIFLVLLVVYRYEFREGATVDINTVLSVHNEYRYAQGLGAIAWDDTLSVSADAWARELASVHHKLIHSRPGENLWQGTAGRYDVAHMVNSWGAEIKFYRYGIFPDVVNDGSQRWELVGHFTQMLKASRVGCGLASDGAWDFFVCHYDRSNMMGEPPY